jgi:hypothetical protein
LSAFLHQPDLLLLPKRKREKNKVNSVRGSVKNSIFLRVMTYHLNSASAGQVEFLSRNVQ